MCCCCSVVLHSSHLAGCFGRVPSLPDLRSSCAHASLATHICWECELHSQYAGLGFLSLGSCKHIRTPTGVYGAFVAGGFWRQSLVDCAHTLFPAAAVCCALLSWVAQMQGVNALLNTHSGVPCVGGCTYTALSASQVLSQSGGLSSVLQWCKLQWSAVRQASWLGYSSTAAERGLLCTCPTYLGLGTFWSRRGAEGSGGAGVYAALSSLCSTSTRLCSTSQYLLYPSLSTLWSGQMGAGIGLAWQGLASGDVFFWKCVSAGGVYLLGCVRYRELM